MKIITRQEAIDKKLTRYFTGEPCTHGHIAERLLSNRTCIECLAKSKQEWGKKPETLEKGRIRTSEWGKKFPHRKLATCRKRQVAKLNRTPKWLTQADLQTIEQMYHLAKICTEIFGIPWHVDHIYPLQGKKVSGLHVPDNLQVIPAKLNLKKSNKHEV